MQVYETARPAQYSRPNPNPSVSAPRFVGDSAVHRATIRQAERFAPFEHATILIEGESGTGKSYVARLIHARSPRAMGAFHQVSLSALDDNLASSDLFGHLSGAYTDARQSRPGHFVTANGGTLFLDEIGKSTAAVQRKLLHAIEHQEITPVGADRSVRLNVRLVAASNIPIESLVEQGSFLEDLAARIITFRIRLPALAERREDIPALARQFVDLRAVSCGFPGHAPRLDADLLHALQHADWPYNLRQLDGVVQRLLIEAAGVGDVELTLAHCTGDLAYLTQSACDDVRLSPALVQERMRNLGSAIAVANSLGVSRWTVYRYLRRGLPDDGLEARAIA